MDGWFALNRWIITTVRNEKAEFRSSSVWLGAGFQAEKVNLNSGSLAIHPNDKPHPRYERPAFRLGFARLVTDYFRHQAWLDDGILPSC